MFKSLKEDVEAVFARDPAARSRLEIFLCYPGLHAILLHRIAHALWQKNLRLTARWISQLGRFFTGIEIHPGAKIGKRFFIDHGMGVVVGETSEIGDDVTLYQGVTLGGVSLNPGKRHPTLGDNVIVGAGAAVLGPFTVGSGARIGSNAVVLREVAPNTTVVGVPAHAVVPRPVAVDRRERFIAYALEPGNCPDPISRAFESLSDKVSALEDRLAELEGRPRPRSADVEPLRPASGDR